MPRLKAVFFDMGGTLLDMKADKAAHLIVLEATKVRYGLDVSVEQLHTWIIDYLYKFQASQERRWRSILELTEEAFREQMARLGVDVDRRDSEWFMKTYKATYRKGVRLTAGAIDTLRGAKLMGLHVGILSDADNEWVDMVLGSLGVRPFLDSITTSESVGVAKPNPRIFVAALRKAKCEPAEAILIGDAIDRDVRGAKAIGMKTVHLAPTPSAEADFQIKTMTELLPILRQLTEAAK